MQGFLMPPFDAAPPQTEPPALDCTANLVISVTPAASSQQDRLRPVISGVSNAIARCGQYVAGDRASITESRNGKVRWSGLARCGSAHSCDHCASSLAEKRALGISAGFESARRDGCEVVYITLTHAPLGFSMAGELDWIDDVTSRLTKRLRERRRALGRAIAGYVVGRDVTFSRFDTHPHQHLAVCVAPEHDPDRVAQSIIGAHLDIVDAHGGRADSAGQNYRIVEPRDDYRTAFYVVSGAVRAGSSDGSSTAADVRTAAAKGDEQAADCYREYVRVMSGRRQVTVSGSLSGTLAPESNPTEMPVVVCEVDRSGFQVLRRNRLHDALTARVAEAVDGGARRLAAHELLLTYLPPASETGQRHWCVNWKGYEDVYYTSRAYTDDHGWRPWDDDDDESIDGWSRAAYDAQQAAIHARPVAVVRHAQTHDERQWEQQDEYRRQHRREQRAACEARKDAVRALARDGNHAAFNAMVEDIAAQWSARIERATCHDQLRILGMAQRSQMRSLARAWFNARRQMADVRA